MAAIKSNPLQALTAAALALPGLLSSSSAAPLDKSIKAGLQYGRYEESSERISVDIYQGTAVIPVSKSMAIKTNWVIDTFSGATPVLTLPEASAQVTSGASGINAVNTGHLAIENEQSVQVMTGASTRETRYGADLGLQYVLGDLNFHASGQYSEEADYLSRGYHLGLDWEFNQKFNTLSLGFGQNFDQIEPTTRPLKQKKTDYHAEIGFSQVVSKKSLLRLSANYSLNDGYLSNPYKKVFIQGLAANSGLQNGGFTNIYYENRPDSRDQWSLSLGYIQYISTLDSALHLDYRFYTDSWSIISHTFEAVYHQPVSKGWMITPRIRYYSQTAADFYRSFYHAPRSDNHYSSDFRLAGFGTLSGGVKLSKEWKKASKYTESIQFELGFEYSIHEAALQLGGKTATEITDFNYALFSSAINVKF